MGGPTPSTVGDIDLGEALGDAWQAMLDNWPIAIGSYLLAGLLMAISIVTCVGVLLLLPIFMWGYSALMLNIIDGDAEVGDLFAGFNQYGEALASMLVFSLAMLVTSLPSSALSVASVALDQPSLSSIGTLVSFLIFFLVQVRLYLAPYYIVDQQMGGFEALRASWEATSDQKMTLALLALLSGLVAFAGFLVLLVGLLFTLPLSALIWTAAYRQLEPLETGAVAPPPPGYAPYAQRS